MIFVVCFYQNPSSGESALINFSFAASCDGAWSIEKWAKEAELNRPLIKKLFGEPYRFQKNHSQWDEFPILNTRIIYEFGWRRVWCGMEDERAGLFEPGADVRYSANYGWAYRDYKQYQKINNSIWCRLRRVLGR